MQGFKTKHNSRFHRGTVNLCVWLHRFTQFAVPALKPLISPHHSTRSHTHTRTHTQCYGPGLTRLKWIKFCTTMHKHCNNLLISNWKKCVSGFVSSFKFIRSDYYRDAKWPPRGTAAAHCRPVKAKHNKTSELSTPVIFSTYYHIFLMLH